MEDDMSTKTAVEKDVKKTSKKTTVAKGSNSKSADKIDTNGKSLFYGKGRVNAYRAVTE